MSHKFTFDKSEAFLLEPGLIENQIREGIVIDAEDVMNLKKANMELAQGNPYTVLVEFADMTSVTKEARELTASKDFLGKTIAEAFLIRSLGQRIIGNFYMAVNKPHINTRLFTDREKALDWLRSQHTLYFAGKLELDLKKF